MAKFATFDSSEITKFFETLEGPARESLARRMGAAGGRVLRDEAKQRAPISDPPYNPNSRGSHQPGTLRDSIYLAFNTTNSSQTVFQYDVTWPKVAYWGKFIEFGWIQKFYVGRNADGSFYTDKTRELKVPIRHPAKPFLRPAYDAAQGRAKAAIIETGKRELPRVLKGE